MVVLTMNILGVSIVMGDTPIAAWFYFMENPTIK
jgi:succinate dehydrogenase hydrophobic anchor subunit